MSKRSVFIPVLGTMLCLTMGAAASAQILFQDSFNSGANWTVLQPADTAATFGYDYANDAIPQAPNGTDRIGLKMEANLSMGVGREFAVVPTNFTPSGNYRVRVDIWGNYAVGGSGTTEFMGAFVGHDGTTPGVNGGGLIYTGDGGALQDVRLYRGDSSVGAQELWIATRGGTRTPSLQYNSEITTDPDGTVTCDPETVIGTSIPDCRDSNFTPFFQNNILGLFDIGFVLDPDNGQGLGQIGPQADGVMGFQWITMQMDVFPTSPGPAGVVSDVGYATVTLLVHGDAQVPNVPPTEVLIGTLDNSAGVGPLVNFSQKPALVYADLFSSVAAAPQFNFGVFDNFVVEQLPGGSVTGDFDMNGIWNCADINALSAAVASGSTDLSFDMNGDGVINGADITDAGNGWLAVGGANNAAQTGGNAFLNGDANLSGAVDGSDFGIWNMNKFSTNSAWCSGDFNASGGIDGSDFGVWNGNKFQSSDGVSAVPEPQLMLLTMAGLLCVPALRRRRSA